jgi:predicted Zn finger-like uncharacterized protein
MPDLTQCPECQRKLSVPDGQLAQEVRCPSCGNQFTAERYIPPRSDAVASEPIEPEPSRPSSRRPRDEDDRRDYDDREDDRPRRRRSPYSRGYGRGSGYERPHRGSTVQALGILSICFFWAALPCWIMGGVALGMASNDLSAMASGNMDASGEGATKAGRTCAIIGLALSGLLYLSCCGFGFLGQAFR